MTNFTIDQSQLWCVQHLLCSDDVLQHGFDLHRCLPITLPPPRHVSDSQPVALALPPRHLRSADQVSASRQ